VVAVTTTSRRRRSSGRHRHLSVVARPAAPIGPRPTTASGAVVVGAGHAVARCDCQGHSAAATGSGPSAGGAPADRRPLSVATYRRRRLAALVVVVGLAIAAWTALGALGGALTAPVRSAPLPTDHATVVEVAPGDTLWSIARRLQPEGDPRPLVDRLATANGGAVVRAGDRLVLG
jgi:nucleoid-associated protein YgaU